MLTPSSARRHTTLRRGLTAIWLSLAAVAVVLGWLLFELGRQGADQQIAQARLRASISCEALRALASRSGLVERGAGGAMWRSGAQAAIDLALRDQPGVEGGLWLPDEGVVAYAFPTYDGTGIKRDAPTAELERIGSTASRAHDGAAPVVDVRPGLREAVVFSACPVQEAHPSAMVAWTLARVPTVTGDNLGKLILALGLLLGFVVLSGGWLGWTLTRWSRGLRSLVDGLDRARSSHGGQGRIGATAVVAPLPGLADLDEVAVALNGYAQRLDKAQCDAERLSAELAQSERMAALGRLSAGMAHEIRNPLGTMRMKAENALAAPAPMQPARMVSALHAVLEQTARLETLVTSLLALTQPFRVQPAPVPWPGWLQERCAAHADAALRQGVDLSLQIEDGLLQALVPADGPAPAFFDPSQMARVLDNLLLNALAHVKTGGKVILGAAPITAQAAAAGQPQWTESAPLNIGLLLWVQDDGPGVPATVRERLFEPFTTGRADGVGLGLALVREIVQAHGGHIALVSAADGGHPLQGARFELELPWPVS